MTRDEILALEPGPELDALVAEKVMGYMIRAEHVCGASGFGMPGDVCPGCREGRPGPFYSGKAHYSTDIAAAWEVAEKVIRWRGSIIAGARQYKPKCWVTISDLSPTPMSGTGETMPEALCKAALLAVEN